MKGNAEIKSRFSMRCSMPSSPSDIRMESDYSAPCRTDPWESCGSLAQKLLHAGRIRKQELMKRRNCILNLIL